MMPARWCPIWLIATRRDILDLRVTYYIITYTRCRTSDVILVAAHWVVVDVRMINLVGQDSRVHLKRCKG